MARSKRSRPTIRAQFNVKAVIWFNPNCHELASSKVLNRGRSTLPRFIKQNFNKVTNEHLRGFMLCSRP